MINMLNKINVSNLLSQYVSTEELTPVFSSGGIEYSRHEVENLQSEPCLLIEASTKISKEDTTVYVGDYKLDVSKHTIASFCEQLNLINIKVKLILGDTDFKDYPALFLTNIETEEWECTKLLSSITDLETLNLFKNKGLISLESKVIPAKIYNYKSALPTKISNNKLIVLAGLDDNSYVDYFVKTNKFIWKINTTSLFTSSPEFISKYKGL